MFLKFVKPVLTKHSSGVLCVFFPVAICEVIASRYCQHKCGLLNMKIEAFKILLSFLKVSEEKLHTASRLCFASRNEACIACELSSPALGSQPCKGEVKGEAQPQQGQFVTSTAWDPKLEVAMSNGNHRLTVLG